MLLGEIQCYVMQAARVSLSRRRITSIRPFLIFSIAYTIQTNVPGICGVFWTGVSRPMHDGIICFHTDQWNVVRYVQ